MRTDRITQSIALFIMIVSAVASGMLLPRVVDQSDRHALRYTDSTVEGAPMFVAAGQSIGALRGLIVTVLWLKVDYMKSQGLFYEVMADAELITKLQPRFPSVWAFQGHNMAYNISVRCNSPAERWDWVQKGIRLVRNEGIRHNPNDIILHRELAFWFSHKIGNVADDGHFYYKTMLAREWHLLLGEPPDDWEARIAWMREIADAAESIAELKNQYPEVEEIESTLRSAFPAAQQLTFEFDQNFLAYYTNWRAFTSESVTAQILGELEEFRNNTPPYFAAFDSVAADPQYAEAMDALVKHVRKRVLLDEYNMDPQLMFEYTRDLGPIDWRHSSAHSLYWSRRGMQFGERRILSDDRIYEVLNTARIQIQSMQELSRNGRVYLDLFSNEFVSRAPDPRWVDPVTDHFDLFYSRYYDTRGGGADTFIDFLENFMGAEVRGAFRRGELEQAEKMLAMLDDRFGTGAGIYANPKYAVPLDVYVRTEVRGQYEAQPTLAPREVQDSLYYGYRVGLGQDRPEVLRQAIFFANETTKWFKGNSWNNYKTRFQSARIGDLVGELEQSAEIALARIMIDSTIPLEERATIWSKIDEFFRGQPVRQRVYDDIMPQLTREFQQSAYSARFESVSEFVPEPPNMEGYRAIIAQQRMEAEAAAEAARETDQTERRGSSSMTPGGG
ncbi:MAG: hypothetical protein AAF432_10795 [Planctomycetota bacterium]